MNLQLGLLTDTHHYLIFTGRRCAAVIEVVPLPIVLVLSVGSI